MNCKKVFYHTNAVLYTLVNESTLSITATADLYKRNEAKEEKKKNKAYVRLMLK